MSNSEFFFKQPYLACLFFDYLCAFFKINMS